MYQINHSLTALSLTLLLVPWGAKLYADEIGPGYHKEVAVTAPTTIDAIFPLGNQSPAEPPAGWLEGYESTAQRYELFVPEKYDAKKSWPVVIFISPGDEPAGYSSFTKACSKLGMIFAMPYAAGNNCPGPRRVRIVLDVLDDVRRRLNTDVDRTYVGGFSGGGRIACYLGFSLPEYFGGVIPVCAAGDLREESWLRRRCIDRLSVALLTGESDFNRGEVERFRGPMLQAVGVRTRIWVTPGLGHGLPDEATAAEALQWLNEAAAKRQALAKASPTTRAAAKQAFERKEQAAQLLAEAEKLVDKPGKTYEALMLLQGVSVRWPDLPTAERATQTLLRYDSDPAGDWRAADVAEQRLFLIARARGLSNYASGDLPQQYAAQRGDMAQAAIALWEQVIDDGQDRQAVAEGKKLLPELTKLSEAK